MSEELAWAAGFFDGEGTTTIQNGKSGRFGVRVQVVQFGPPLLLERFQRAVGVGKIYGPYTKGAPDKIYYYWIASSLKSAWSAISQLWPWLGEPKREQAVRRFVEFYLQRPAIPLNERWKGGERAGHG